MAMVELEEEANRTGVNKYFDNYSDKWIFELERISVCVYIVRQPSAVSLQIV